MLRNQKGMTLLEIMIVLAIIASVTAILATTVRGQMKKAQMKQARIQLGEIQKALDMFYTDCHTYPASGDGLQALVTQPGNCSDWGPEPYLKRMPKDPWGSEFVYESEGNDYIVKSLGSDKREGGTGDAADISSKDL